MTRAEADKAYSQTVMIVLSLIMGVVMFAGASWYTLAQREGSTHGIEPILIYAWIAIAVTDAIVAYLFLQRFKNQLEAPGARERIRAGTLTPTMVQTNIIVVWALIEGAALFGVVNFFLGAPPAMLWTTLGYLAVAAAIFFPRREWFDLFRETASS